MAQETLNGLLQYIILTLPLEDKKWFAQQLEEDIRIQVEKPETPEELKAELRQAYQDAVEGRVYSQEQAHQMMDEFVNAHTQAVA